MLSTKKERIGWYFYNWANHAFYTSVVTVFIGPYLTIIAKNSADSKGFLNILGLEIYHGSYFAYVLSLSVILQVFLLPVIGAIADKSNLKKQLLGIFAYIGSLSTMCLYFLNGQKYLFGGFLFVVANLSLGASIVMYNAYLNDIAEPKDRDKVSSIGWAIGYIGGGILLGLNLILFSFRYNLGLNTEMAFRISLCSAGVWWAFFTILPMFSLKIRKNLSENPKKKSYIKSGFSQLIHTLRDSRNYPQTLLFLAAFLFYNDGVQAVIALSVQFGNQELGISISSLTTLILIVQFVAFFGSLLFAYLAGKTNTKLSIIISLIIWIAAIFWVFAKVYTELDFYIIAIIIAIVLGGSQALSRSLFSRLLPKGKEAEYFSLYEVGESGTSWMGPLLFGLSLQLTKSYRIAIFSLIVFFIIGLTLLIRVNIKKAEERLAIDN